MAGIFAEWLDQHAPGQKEKILNRVRHMRSGKLNDPRFGSRMRGAGFYAEQMAAMYRVARRTAGFPDSVAFELSTAAFRVPTDQLSLW